MYVPSLQFSDTVVEMTDEGFLEVTLFTFLTTFDGAEYYKMKFNIILNSDAELIRTEVKNTGEIISV